MEQQHTEKRKTIITQDKAYFNMETYINLESTDVKDILSKMIKEILEKICIYQRNGSGWYFKEVSSLEIHIVHYKPIKGSSYIPLPDFIMKLNAKNENPRPKTIESIEEHNILERYIHNLNELREQAGSGILHFSNPHQLLNRLELLAGSILAEIMV